MNPAKLIAITAVAAAASATAAWTLTPGASSHASAASNVSAERGRYLVSTSACHDCHTPWKMGAQGPEPDMTRMLSGHPANVPVGTPPASTPEWPTHASATMTSWAGPWGVSFTANLTSDKATGIGAWTADEFVTALRTGRHQGKGRPILPPMPWQVYGQMTDDDLRSIFAYLQTVPPVANKVPEPLPPQAPQAK